MSDSPDKAGRRGFLLAAAGAAGAAGTVAAAASVAAKEAEKPERVSASLPFHGAHQNGIACPMQSNAYFAAFDLETGDRADVIGLLRAWTLAAARMSEGKTAQPIEETLAQAKVGEGGAYAAQPARPAVPGAAETLGQAPTGMQEGEGQASQAADTGEVLGLSPAKLTLTFGFGAGLFSKDGKDRYGLAKLRPEALVDLPKFVGDQLVEERSGGDLLVQACADDPQVAFHAVRQLARIAGTAARIRWVQAGFLPATRPGETPRNLMGFKDGTNNPSIDDASAMDKFVWVGADGPHWMQGGSYAVTRRIRIALEHWDRMKVAFQEETVGRRKYSGAPIGRERESQPLDLAATDKDGNPLIAENAHVRLASAEANDGAQILRRGYSYNDGVNFTTERWPPWRQGMEYDSGLFFVCYQRDPRTGFVKLFERMAKFDMLNQFVTHVSSGLFACPRGAREGEYIGQALFEHKA